MTGNFVKRLASCYFCTDHLCCFSNKYHKNTNKTCIIPHLSAKSQSLYINNKEDTDFLHEDDNYVLAF